MVNIAKTNQGIHRISNKVGGFLVEVFHLLGLFAIGAATAWAAATAFIGMVQNGHASVEDLLLLFIYLEIGAMVGIYFKTSRMPVRFVVYVAITALTRHMIGFVNIPHAPKAEVAQTLNLDILGTAGAILLLAIAVLLLRVGSFKYPSDSVSAGQTDLPDIEPR